MHSTLLAVLVFIVLFAAGLAGIVIGRRLPAHHLEAGTKEAIRLMAGLVATITALVLSLLISSAHSSFDHQSSEVQQLGAQLVELDQVLAHFGPQANDARTQLRRRIEAEVARLWNNSGAGRVAPPDRSTADGFYSTVAGLKADSEARRFDQSRALQLMTSIGETNRLLHEQASDSLSWRFFAVLVFWLGALFFGYGLHAPHNATVIVAFSMSALVVAGAIWLILEMNRPYS